MAEGLRQFQAIHFKVGRPTAPVVARNEWQVKVLELALARGNNMSTFFIDQDYRGERRRESRSLEQETVVTAVTVAQSDFEQQLENKIKFKWTAETKIQLVEIDNEEREKGRFFMNTSKRQMGCYTPR